MHLPPPHDAPPSFTHTYPKYGFVPEGVYRPYMIFAPQSSNVNDFWRSRPRLFSSWRRGPGSGGISIHQLSIAIGMILIIVLVMKCCNDKKNKKKE